VPEKVKDLYLIDASIYVFRAWFSLPDTLNAGDGTPVNAVYGYLRFLTEFLEKTTPQYVAVAFDESLTTSFRNEIYPEYKANRDLPPPELERQFKVCQDLTRALGIRSFCHERFEADDLIATIAHQMRTQGFRNIVVSGDKDLTQVLSGADLWWDYARHRTLDVHGVKQRFGVRSDQIRDYLALVGDAVDNIPGLPGVGPKTAVRLLRLYPDLEAVYANLAQIPQLAIRGAGRIAKNLDDHREQVFLSRRLATVALDAPLTVGSEALEIEAPDDKILGRLVEWMARGDGYVERIKSVLPVR
jgi:5'-3' exonuclease